MHDILQNGVPGSKTNVTTKVNQVTAWGVMVLIMAQLMTSLLK
jgi:hypothetical protein